MYKLRTFKGTVVRFWPQQGYGFVRLDASPREAIFLLRHVEDVGGDQIRQGTRLQFYLEQHSKGLRAIRCKLEEA
jgi:cold shock CspA family protein